MADSSLVDALVIGAGVSGLTTAIILAESGLRVRVLAELPPHRTTSAVAGASWGPYLASDSRILRWSTVTLAALQQIARAGARTGVRLVPGLEAADHPLQPPEWARTVDGFRECEVDELPVGYVSGWRYTIPLIEMSSYLNYLEDRLGAAGCTVEIGRVTSIENVTDAARVVVNCSGLGSRSLAADSDIEAARGQILVVTNPGVVNFFQDHAKFAEPTYVFPHGDHIVLGGSIHSGTTSLEPNARERDQILARCRRVEPLLAEAELVEVRVGLRPNRSRVRLDTTTVAGTPVIHNYGHGGSGVTLSWGCAQDVAQLLQGLGLGAAA